jgi:hypothetical protein
MFLQRNFCNEKNHGRLQHEQEQQEKQEQQSMRCTYVQTRIKSTKFTEFLLTATRSLNSFEIITIRFEVA